MRGLVTGIGLGYILFTENGHKLANGVSDMLIKESKKQIDVLAKEVKSTYEQLKEVEENGQD